MRLIDADAVLERIELACDMRCLYKDYKEPLRSKMCNCCELGDARMYVEDAPTVDAEPIQHGYWEALYAHEEPTSNVYRCSNCGKGFADYLDDDYDYYNEYPVFFEYDRCPHCGAIMDGDTVYPTYRPDGKYEEFWKNRTIEVEEDGID